MLLRNIKNFYNKKGFDYSAGYVDPREYHLIFYYFQRAYQVIDEPSKPWTYVSKILTTVCGMGVLTDACFSIYRGIQILDMYLIVEASTYFLMLSYKMMTIVLTIVYVSSYTHLMQSMKDDFKYICTKDDRYKKVFFDIQLGTWKACIGTFTFMACMATCLVSYAIIVLVIYLMIHAPGERTDRPLVFPFWAPGIDYTTTPAFEIAFTFANVGVYACTYNYTFVLQTNLVWVRHIATKAEMIGMCIKDLLDGIHPTEDEVQKQKNARLINFRMKEIVANHISMYKLVDSYALVYKKCLMFEQLISSPVVCMLTYCSAEKIDNGEVHVVMMVLCAGAILVLFIPCYLATYLRSKLSMICDMCWEIRFWDASEPLRPYLVLIMQRCLRPLPLQAPGFQEVSIKTFSSKMTSAYSLFNMLRQADLDF